MKSQPRRHLRARQLHSSRPPGLSSRRCCVSPYGRAMVPIHHESTGPIMQTISIPHAPAPAGHYSPSIAHGGLVFVSGQLPVNPLTGAVVGEGDIDAQAEQALRNVEAVLLAGGSSL